MRPAIYLVLLALTLSVPLFAAKKKTAKKTPPARTITVFKKGETHKFTGLKLKGQLKKPDLSYIYKRRGLRAEQIVNIPENFDEAIIQGEGQF